MMLTCLQIFICISLVMVKFTDMFTIQTKQMPKMGQLADQVDVTGYTTRKIYPGFKRAEDTTLQICGIDSLEDDYYGCVELEKSEIPQNYTKVKLRQNKFRNKPLRIIPLRNTIQPQGNSLHGLNQRITNIMTLGIPTKKYRRERKKNVILNKVSVRKSAHRQGIENDNLNEMNDTNDFTQTKVESITKVQTETLKTTKKSETSISQFTRQADFPFRHVRLERQHYIVHLSDNSMKPCNLCHLKTLTFVMPASYTETTISTKIYWYLHKIPSKPILPNDANWLGKPARDSWPTMSTSPPQTTRSTLMPFG